MKSLLNKERPPMFCPGCTHERIVISLDKAFKLLNLTGKQIAIVSDIGCSGLFDTFFNTNAMHGLHGRALTYATGIKMAKPTINAIVTMGDGGLGIGGAHFLAACRRNLNLTLLILNNFNFGMTGGQFSPTTPSDATVGSGFLNQLEKPIDICKIAKAAGAPYVIRCSSYNKELSQEIATAISYPGMAVMDIHGICSGRYTKLNKLTPKIIETNLSKMAPFKNGEISINVRNEYGQSYNLAPKKTKTNLYSIKPTFQPIQTGRQEIIILGRAGQRIITAGEILCLAGLTSGLSVNQKNDYPITVLRGHSISNLVLSTKEIEYTGITNPKIIIAIAKEGIDRKKNLLKKLTKNTLIIIDSKLKLPITKAKIKKIDFKTLEIKPQNKAVACLAIMAEEKKIIETKMLKKAIELKFKGKNKTSIMNVVKKIKNRK